MSFCDEHGTSDYCGECIYGPDIERLEKQLREAKEALSQILYEEMGRWYIGIRSDEDVTTLVKEVMET